MTSPTIDRIMERVPETRALRIGAGCMRDLPPLFASLFPGRSAFIIADDNTFQAAGDSAQSMLTAVGIITFPPLIFSGSPTLHADHEHCAIIVARIHEYGAVPIAVGSGTINDLVKRAAFEAGVRYLVVATAASVDGYSSFGAALSVNQFKKTMECPAPLAILADPDILRSAPTPMGAAGYADLASKLTAGADWLIADAAGADPIDPEIWAMVQPPLRGWLAHPEGLKSGDAKALDAVFEGLTMTGFAMQVARQSRPASGSDHLFSHIWEMLGILDPKGEPPSHGFKVAIGTLIATAMMEICFRRPLTDADIEHACEQWPSWNQVEAAVASAFSSTPMYARVLEESAAKYIDTEALRARLRRMQAQWGDLGRKVADQLMPYADLRDAFLKAECPVTPQEIGLTREAAIDTAHMAQMIRNRYTILDLLVELAWMPDVLALLKQAPEYLTHPFGTEEETTQL